MTSSLDIDSKASQGGSKKEKAVQPKRRKTSRLNLLHLLFFYHESSWFDFWFKSATVTVTFL